MGNETFEKDEVKQMAKAIKHAHKHRGLIAYDVKNIVKGVKWVKRKL